MVNTVSELLEAAAAALTARDVEALEDLLEQANDWLQTEEEREALAALLEAMIDAATELAGAEEEEDEGEDR